MKKAAGRIRPAASAASRFEEIPAGPVTCVHPGRRKGPQFFLW